MELLKRELERKKKAVELAKLKQGMTTVEGRTFLKASELRRMQEEEEEERQRKRKQKDDEQKSDDPKKRSRREEKETRKNAETNLKAVTLEAVPDTSHQQQRRKHDFSPSEIIQRFRNLRLPIRLFGETDAERLERLGHALEQQQHMMAGLSEMDEFRLGQGHGIRNPFLDRKKEQEDNTTPTTSVEPVAKIVPQDMDNDHHKGGDQDEDSDDPHKRIYRFFKGLLKQWEDDLALRPEAVKRTPAGKNETKTLKQCKDYIRPLFKLCKTRRLETSLMNHILKIVEYCQQGEFVKAHDSYMDVAIGRAAWPIGVTMVGIHARSGRAKIESSNVAHVMNSELQRKYLTSVKRLMSYYQNKRADVAPSKKVMN